MKICVHDWKDDSSGLDNLREEEDHRVHVSIVLMISTGENQISNTRFAQVEVRWPMFEKHP